MKDSAKQCIIDSWNAKGGRKRFLEAHVEPLIRAKSYGTYDKVYDKAKIDLQECMPNEEVESFFQDLDNLMEKKFGDVSTEGNKND